MERVICELVEVWDVLVKRSEYLPDPETPSIDEVVKALKEARAVRLMIARQENIEAYTFDLDDMIAKLEEP